MHGQPKTIGGELIDEIIRHAAAAEIPELALKRLSTRAGKLLKADAPAGYMALGMIAALSFDHEALDKHHKAAIALAPFEPAVYFNYIVSLYRVSSMDKALAVSRQFYDKHSADLRAKCMIFGGLVLSGRYIEAENLLVAHPEVAKSLDGHPREVAEKLPEITKILQTASIADDEVQDLYGLYYSAIAELKVAPVTHGSVFIHDGEIIVHLKAPVRASVMSDTTWSICEKLAVATDKYGHVTGYIGFTLAGTLGE